MFCPNCGTKCADGTRFCEECGCLLVQNDTDTLVDDSQGHEEQITVNSQQYGDYGFQRDSYQQNSNWNVEPAFVNIPQPPEEPKSSKKGIVVGIVISVVVLIIAVFAALIISGVIEINFSEKETTTQAEEKKKEKEDKETTTEEESIEEDTTEVVDTNAVAKQNLEGSWTISIACSSEPVFGNSYEMTLPLRIDFKSDGTYSILLDDNSYDAMIYEMIDEYLAEEGYFNMDDVEKSSYLAEYEVSSELDLYELLYNVFAENVPIEDYEGWIDEMPMSKEGFWAINGDYLYFTDSESQVNAFMSNPSAYKYDSIRTNLTHGPKDFQIKEGDESIIFRKR